MYSHSPPLVPARPNDIISDALDLSELYVIKRSGRAQPVSFDKVLSRIRALCKADGALSALHINGALVAQKVCGQIYPGVTTTKLDDLASQLCSSLSTNNPEYGELASRIVVSNHHKNTHNTFEAVVRELYENGGCGTPLVSNELRELVRENVTWLEGQIDYERDYQLDFFGFKTLERSYLLRVGDKVVERPQHLWMRVALGLYGKDLARAIKCYHELSQKWYTHATPTLFNSGTPHHQLASCFLLAMKSDSIGGIFETLKDCAQISKHSGGIGLWIHNIRSTGSTIRGTNGASNGIVPMLRVFNDTARYVDQGGGKRNGSFAIYLEPWHPNIYDFLQLKKNHGDEQLRARDLFYSLWVPDLFMRRVKEDAHWTLFNPDACPGLCDSWGEKFEQLYAQYERDGRGEREVRARELWHAVLEAQTETGTPYILFKDSCNRKSNQQNLGTIRSSNLCTEIIEYSSPDETAVCNLASISLPSTLVHRSLRGSAATLHTRPDCAYCKLAHIWLRRLGMVESRIEVVTYTTSEQRKEFQTGALDRFGHEVDTFPLVVLDGKCLGGYDDLIEATRPSVDYEKLERIARSLTRNLNQTIDRTYYPTPEARRSNLRHRPIGIGVQGLSNIFMEMRLPFESAEAQQLNRRLFATIYYGAMSESVAMAKERTEYLAQFGRFAVKHGCGELSTATGVRKAFDRARWEEGGANATRDGDAGRAEDIALALTLLDRIQPLPEYETPQLLYALRAARRGEREGEGEGEDTVHEFSGAYSTFRGSPLQQGQFQFDLWDAEAVEVDRGSGGGGGGGSYAAGGDSRYDWTSLRADAMRWGARNSLLVAPMPTASTSQILGNNECFEPITSNIYVRRTLAGEFVVINRYLLRDLIDHGLWSNELKEQIIFREGSIQGIAQIPSVLRELYKTVWEIKQRVLVDMAAERGRYICQSQSMNLFLARPTVNQLTSMLFYGWERGLKTGIYYLRTKPASKAQQFTLDAEKYGGGCTNCSA